MDKSRYDAPTTRTPDQIIEDGHRMAMRSDAEQLHEQLAAAAKFKAFVHGYLDQKGIPPDPGGPHSLEGCRIGDRLDLVFAELERLRAVIEQSAEGIKPCDERELNWCRLHDAPRDLRRGEPCYIGAVRQRLLAALAK